MCHIYSAHHICVCCGYSGHKTHAKKLVPSHPTWLTYIQSVLKAIYRKFQTKIFCNSPLSPDFCTGFRIFINFLKKINNVKNIDLTSRRLFLRL